MSESIRFVLCNCEETILSEIAAKGSTRRDVALTYRMALCSPERRSSIDWAKVNGAIIDRWSPSALQWIKREAWKGLES